jgi:hypothetical protein
LFYVASASLSVCRIFMRSWPERVLLTIFLHNQEVAVVTLRRHADVAVIGFVCEESSTAMGRAALF